MTLRRPMRTRNICFIKRCSGPGRSIVDGAPVHCGRAGISLRGSRNTWPRRLKEAKLNTSWIQPNENWDAAMQRFRRQDSRSRRPRNKFFRQLSAGGGRNRATRRDQFARPNRAQTDLAGRAGHLSGKRNLGRQPGRSGQSAASRLRPAPRNADADRKVPRERIDAMLAGRADQNVPDPAITAFAPRKSGAVPRRNYEPINFGGAFADCCDRFCAARQRPGDHCDRAALVIARRFSADRRRWQDTHVVRPAGMSNLRDVFSDRKVRVEKSQLRLAVAMSQLPFACFRVDCGDRSEPRMRRQI